MDQRVSVSELGVKIEQLKETRAGAQAAAESKTASLTTRDRASDFLSDSLSKLSRMSEVLSVLEGRKARGEDIFLPVDQEDPKVLRVIRDQFMLPRNTWVV